MSSRRGKKANTGKKATKKGRTVKKARVKDLDLGELEGRKVRGGAISRIGSRKVVYSRVPG